MAFFGGFKDFVLPSYVLFKQQCNITLRDFSVPDPSMPLEGGGAMRVLSTGGVCCLVCVFYVNACYAGGLSL